MMSGLRVRGAGAGGARVRRGVAVRGRAQAPGRELGAAGRGVRPPRRPRAPTRPHLRARPRTAARTAAAAARRLPKPLPEGRRVRGKAARARLQSGHVGRLGHGGAPRSLRIDSRVCSGCLRLCLVLCSPRVRMCTCTYACVYVPTALDLFSLSYCELTRWSRVPSYLPPIATRTHVKVAACNRSQKKTPPYYR